MLSQLSYDPERYRRNLALVDQTIEQSTGCPRWTTECLFNYDFKICRPLPAGFEPTPPSLGVLT